MTDPILTKLYIQVGTNNNNNNKNNNKNNYNNKNNNKNNINNSSKTAFLGCDTIQLNLVTFRNNRNQTLCQVQLCQGFSKMNVGQDLNLDRLQQCSHVTIPPPTWCTQPKHSCFFSMSEKVMPATKLLTKNVFLLITKKNL